MDDLGEQLVATMRDRAYVLAHKSAYDDDLTVTITIRGMSDLDREELANIWIGVSDDILDQIKRGNKHV